MFLNVDVILDILEYLSIQKLIEIRLLNKNFYQYINLKIKNKINKYLITNKS